MLCQKVSKSHLDYHFRSTQNQGTFKLVSNQLEELS